MTKFTFYHDLSRLPLPSRNMIPVQLHGINTQTSYIGNTLIASLKQKPVRIPVQAMDFLSIAMAVTAADTFVQRKTSEDGWSRQFVLELPLCEPDRWETVKNKLENTMHFLSGDTWAFEFRNGGLRPPNPSKYHISQKRKILQNLDSVSLFSGGLDSAIGAIDLLEMGNKPLLVSHAYKGDKSHQEMVKKDLQDVYWHYQFNADPHLIPNNQSEISMRTRSFNFIAFGILSVCILQAVTGKKTIELLIPENGFISLNAPLTLRRIGSLSTRTTHPFFISSMRDILQAVELPARIRNPYQFMTKGEMVLQCKNKNILNKVVNNSISCSHWYRTNKQCGICVPCLIRRSSLFTGHIKENDQYLYNNIISLLKNPSKSDDIISLMSAILRAKNSNIKSWILNNAPLSYSDIDKYERIFIAGLSEVETFLSAEGINIS